MVDVLKNPAEHLEGRQIGDWKVVERIINEDGHTGGNFSVGYIVRNKFGDEAFLKAMNYIKAIGKPNQADELYRLTQAFRFERDLLIACANGHMKYVVRIIDANTYIPDDTFAYAVDYIIFEKAEHSARSIIDVTKNFDYAWSLRSLHNVAVATQELHGARIAHQDIKPSNVMMFDKNRTSKLGDVGRSSRLGNEMPHDFCVPAGDKTYSPFEQLYGFCDPEWYKRRYSCDMFMVGNLISVYFNNISITAATFSYLPENLRPNHGTLYSDALPYLETAFSEAVEGFNPNMKDKELRHELQMLVREMCNPDIDKRGDSKERGIAKFSLYRYITRLDILASRYEYSLKKGIYS